MKALLLKVPADVHLQWKLQAVREQTTMSEIAVRLISEYLKRKGVK